MQETEKHSVMYDEHDKTDLLDYWEIIWGRRRFIALCVIVATISTVAASLLMTEIYRANVVIAAVGEGQVQRGGLSELASRVGGLPGISLPGSTSSTEIVNRLHSHILRKKVLEKYKLLPILFPDEWNAEKKEWKTKDDSPTVWDGLRRFDDMVGIKDNLKENTITMHVDFHDPEMAVKIVNYMLTTLNDHMSGESRRVAETNRKYLEKQLNHSADPLIRKKIYNLIAQQIETSMMAGVKENFAFMVIDPPMVPDRRIKPKRRKMLVFSFLLSLSSGIFLALLLGNIEKENSMNGKD